MFSLNRAQIVGKHHVPEMRYTHNGQAVCSFGVATNRRWQEKMATIKNKPNFITLLLGENWRN